jgi:uncharacterized protein involved in tolerance to divalent cations
MRFSIQLEVGMAYGAIMSTIDDRDRAEQFARLLLDLRLVACVNMIEPMMSLYHWQDTIARDAEYLLLLKIVATEALTLKWAHSRTLPLRGA